MYNVTLSLLKEEIKRDPYLREAPKVIVSEVLSSFMRHVDAYPEVYKVQPNSRKAIANFIKELYDAGRQEVPNP